MSSLTDVELEQEIKNKIIEPNMYNVIMYNDDLTTFDWVVHVLMTVFRHSKETSEFLANKVHNEQSTIVGTYTYEIAEQKAYDAILLSRKNNFPLDFKVEEN